MQQGRCEYLMQFRTRQLPLLLAQPYQTQRPCRSTMQTNRW
jgi:hypothetical protein